jgi:hypothetical protein
MMPTKNTNKHPLQASTGPLTRVHALMLTNAVAPLLLKGGFEPGFLQRLAPRGSRAQGILPLSPGNGVSNCSF